MDTECVMLTVHLRECFGDWEEASKHTLVELQGYYKEAKIKFNEDSSFRERVVEAVFQLMEGKDTYQDGWECISKISRLEYDQLYQRLGIHLEEKDENLYTRYIPAVIEQLEEKGIIKHVDGAKVIFAERQANPLTIVRSDGRHCYAAILLAGLWHQLTEENAELIKYVFDYDRRDQFNTVFRVLRLSGWIPDKIGRWFPAQRVPVCRVFGYRSVDLLDRAKDQSKKWLSELDTDYKWSPEELEDAATAIGSGSAIFTLLRQTRTSECRFNLNLEFDISCNTYVCVLHAYAHVCSIINSSNKDMEELTREGEIHIEHEKEKNLGVGLIHFPEVVEDSFDSSLPELLCKYLYYLSINFLEFESTLEVARDQISASKLLLCKATAIVMAKCLHLLGIAFPCRQLQSVLYLLSSKKCNNILFARCL